MDQKPDDVRMVQPGNGLHLGVELVVERTFPVPVGRQYLHGDRVLIAHTMGAPHRAGAAGGDRLGRRERAHRDVGIRGHWP